MRPRGRKHGLDVDLHDAPVFLGLLVDHAAAAADADVVVEEIEPAPVIDGGVDQPLALRFLGDVAGMGDGMAALGLDHLDRALGELQIEIGHHHPGAGASEQDRRGAAVADAVILGAAARHDGDLVLETQIVLRSFHGVLAHGWGRATPVARSG